MTDIQRLRAELDAYAKCARDPKIGLTQEDQLAISQLETALAIRDVGAELQTALSYFASELATLRTNMDERAGYPLSILVCKG